MNYMQDVPLSEIYAKHHINFDYDLSDSAGKHKGCYLFPLDKTIHYKSIATQDFDDYCALIATTKQPEHSLEVFRDLIGNFDIYKMKPINLWFNKQLRKFIVSDGCHRLAIGMNLNIFKTHLPVRHVNLRNDWKLQKNIEEILKTTVNRRHSNGWSNRTEFGHHSYNLGVVNITGQRNPAQRLWEIKKHVDFHGKTVVDFGCNAGGMLHHLPEISRGYGFDFDDRCVNAANQISILLGREELEYQTHDFDRQDYSLLKQKLPTHCDVAFLLSLGSWVKSWKTLYGTALECADKLVVEVNNKSQIKDQIGLFQERGWKAKMIIDNSKDDSTGNNRRKTYLVEKA